MDSVHADKRAQRRIEAAIPIQVRGVDASGVEYDDPTVAIEVSRRGLSFLTKRELTVSATLSVTIPGRGPMLPGEGPSDFFAEAKVVRSTREADEQFRVGVRFMGVTLPMYSSESL
jgi:hypothetical protein